MSLSGKIALVTGGSRGIGREISLELARRGASVYVNYSASPDAAKETASECGNDAQAIGFNVGDSKAVDAGIESILKRSGKIDILINNAGISRDGLLMRMKDDDLDAVLATNLKGAMYCTRAAVRSMMRSRWGRVVNISSVVGEMGNAGQAVYVSSKAGLIGFTKAVAREMASRSITVNAITPGFIETQMTDGLSEELRNEHLKIIPLGRYGKANEVASAVAFLASEDAAYITGQVLGVNGGMYM